MAAGSYNVQDCDVTTDNTSILVECTFAINSTAPGIVYIVIQDDQNIDYTTLVRNGDKGSVNITGLPAGEYNVRVYDNMEDNSPAYEHCIILRTPPSPSPSSIPSPASTSTAYASSSAGYVRLTMQCKLILIS